MAPSLFSLFFSLFVVLEAIHNVSAAVVYGLTTGKTGNNVIVSINNSTGEFSVIAGDTDYNYAGLFLGLSCFDQTNKVFYYVTDKALYLVDVEKHKELPLIKYGESMVTSCIWNTSNLLVALENNYTQHTFKLLSYPLVTNTGKPEPLANLSANNISWAVAQAYDPVRNIFYSIYLNDMGNALLLHKLYLDEPIHATQALFPCLHNVPYMKFDPIQNKLVGITINATSAGDPFYYAFVIEDDGSCTLSKQILGMFEFGGITYDPNTATFYLCSISYVAIELCIFETKTGKTTIVEIENIIYAMEVQY
eukprot:Phypoly_transcript_13660.p1 GENE.Phypoly_transcript_13660~~Phypoly_transcript_13660.p1  ORF type:complete len:307 (+),score=25.20 Phypoly_transcript_13660:58-978(+)